MYKLNTLWGTALPKVMEYSDSGSDDYNNYLQNRVKMGEGWQYYYNQVNYIRNDYGHRVSINPQEFNNGLLFTGCSITEGISVKLEETYPYIVSNYYKIPYYNLALGASSIDMVATNLSLWFKYYNKPSTVIIQWPEYHRHTVVENNIVKTVGPWLYDNHKLYSHNTKQDYKTITNTNYLEMYGDIIKNITYNMLASHNINYIELKPIIEDVGRDLKHPGSMSHLRMANNVIQKLGPVV